MENEVWADWPVCPTCGRKRQAVCPGCKSESESFPLGHQMEEESPRGYDGQLLPLPPHRVWLICEDCSEAFRPRFFSRCAACGHHFEEGVAPPTFDREVEMTRLSAAALGVGVIAVAIWMYLYVL